MQRGQQEDRGMCLSMHQPWASLLVAGLKRIEGRGWPTNHRGRLWIASTAQPPDPADIKQYCELYRRLHCELEGKPSVVMPQSYPTGCLVGCVDVVGCLSAEQIEGWQGLPPSLVGELGSPFGFLAERPQELVVKHPMRGAHKIYPLEKRIHRAALQGLRPAPAANTGGSSFSWAAFGPPPAPHDPSLQPSARKHQFAAEQAAKKKAAGPGGSSGGSSGRGLRGAGGQQPQASRAAPAAADQRQHPGQQEQRQQQQAPLLPRALMQQLLPVPGPSPGEQEQQEQQKQDPARRLRSVRKKLRQIELLEEAAAGGRELSAEESEKVAGRAALERQAAELEAVPGGAR